MNKTYDRCQVALKPQLSLVNSRDDVDLSVRLSDHLTLKIPIIVSPMLDIVSPELITGIGFWGGLGILHRFYKHDNEGTLAWEQDIKYIREHRVHFGLSVGLNEFARVIKALDFGCDILCIDVANGYLDSVSQFVEEISNLIHQGHYQTLLMAGCVSTYAGANRLWNYGADIIRVGIGTGHLCRTWDVTGVHYGQISALQECSGIESAMICSDGGIRTSGDAIKDIAAGADVVMLGTLFAQCKESAHNGKIMGMASKEMQEEYYTSIKSIEGVAEEMEKTTTLDEFLGEFTWGMKSACTYLGAKNLSELYANAEFVEV